MTVKELIDLLLKENPNAQIGIAPTPDRNGWVYDPLDHLGRGSNGEVILGCPQDSVFTDEIDIEW